MYPTYSPEPVKLRPRPEANTKVVNFEWLKDLLLSKDLSRNAELNWVNPSDSLRFLDGASMLGNYVAFQSMPRSGNSFLRRIIEIVTGVYSGSDMNYLVTIMMMGSNMSGEDTVPQDNLCWITKTHWPMNSPMGATKFPAQKCFSIVRNPIDMIASFCLLMNTASHSATTTVPINEVDPEYWDKFAPVIWDALNKSQIAMADLCEPAIPTYYIRYEDLVLNPKPVLMELFAFLLDVDNVVGTVVEQRIDDYCDKGNKGASVYKLKADPRKNLCRNRGMYTEDQLERLKEQCREYLYYFNYVDCGEAGESDPNTAFMTYDGETKHDPELLSKLYNGYKKANVNALASVSRKETTETEPMKSFTFNESFPADPDIGKVGVICHKLTIKEPANK